jgi:hypothetical protein
LQSRFFGCDMLHFPGLVKVGSSSLLLFLLLSISIAMPKEEG